MEMHRIILKRIIILESEFHRLFMATMNDPSEKKVHKLRVVIKKWKALAKLLSSIDPQMDIKQWLDPIKKLFREAGKLRDFHIKSEIVISKYKAEKRNLVRKQFHAQEKELALHFQSFESRFSLVAFRQGLRDTRARIKALSKDLLYKRLTQYFKKNLKELIRLNQACQDERELLHAYRIHLKSFYYNLLFVLEGKNQTKLFADQISLLDEFLEAIGIWHDHAILIIALKREGGDKQKIKEHFELMLKWESKLDLYWKRLHDAYTYFYDNLPLILTFQQLQEHKSDKVSYHQMNIKRSLK